jgi:hypothetical protein
LAKREKTYAGVRHLDYLCDGGGILVGCGAQRFVHG